MSPMLILGSLALQAAPTPPVAAPPSDPQDRAIVCRRYAETGSLVRRRKVCMTKAQWAKAIDFERAAVQRHIDDNMGRPPGG